MIDIDAALAALTIEQKCRLLTGATTWRTMDYSEAGVPPIKMSDGPAGVRGEGHGGSGTPGVVVPSAITLGSTWDPDLAGQIGELLGTEARRKAAHVLLAPTINLHRTPLGGRTFECYSEDPELTAQLATSYVRGVQSQQVGVTVKHFVGNDTEIDRMRVDVQMDERTQRELYLRPFERVVRDAGAWGIMSAYNRLGGTFCASNRDLLTGVLRDEWGFDGFVVSDWFGAHETVLSAQAGLNLEMPAPVRVYGRFLEDAVGAGEIDESRVDELVRDLLVLANRVHADERAADAEEVSVDDPAERALTRRAAIAGTILLRNDERDGSRVLPFDVQAMKRVAVVGPNAAIDRSMGGGSASLVPLGHRTLCTALEERIGPGTDTDVAVVYEPGVRIDRLTPLARGSQLLPPVGVPSVGDRQTGMEIEYVNGTDWTGPTELTQPAPTSLVRFFGSVPDGVDPRAFSARVRGRFVPDIDGTHTVGVVSTGPVVARVGGVTIADDPNGELPRSTEFFGYGSIEVTAEIEMRAGEPVDVEVDWATSAENGFAAFRVGFRPHEDYDALLDRAVAAAADADAAIVMVGTNDEWETEGFDRTTMDLPGRQDELVERVAAANPNTAVIVNTGSPVTMDWAGDGGAPAVLTSFFAGQEQAEALVDVLFGDADPGGRLPITIPRRLADHPAYLHHQPDHDACGGSTQRYGEGLFMGYRGYEAREIPTRFPFGHGLSYGTASWGSVNASASVVRRAALATSPIVVTVPITAGDRETTVVVQGYVAPIEPSAVRPPKELKAFAKRVLAADTSTTIELVFSTDAFARWDTRSHGWVVDPGEYDLVIASSAEAFHERVKITVE
ncbi:MAG: glycoside hydrolase family 3 C-terminal domain-containing protein [Actinomycetota bacterium]